ncbi:MAG: PID-CTERM protein-sorting domain-containing protein [Janthinobacterium lividum]
MLRYLTTICLLVFALASQAQAPGSTGPTPSPQAPTAVPLDGGASLLLAGGAAYGLRRLRQLRRA